MASLDSTARTMTGRDTVAKIAKVLEVTPQELLGTPADNDVNQAVRLIARNASSLTEEQRVELISALAKR